MKDQETVQKFIELRAQGVSFARIAEQLSPDFTTPVDTVPEAQVHGEVQDWNP